MEIFVPAFPPRLRYGALAVACIGFALLSPKWTVPLAAWVAPAALLLFIRHTPWKQVLCWAVPALTTANALAQHDVAPLPLPAFAVFIGLGSAAGLLPYFLDAFLWRRLGGFRVTLVFPCLMVCSDYLTSFSPWGVWGQVANTQFAFLYLVQLVSVTGLWGISFMVYWFASVLVWSFENQWRWGRIRRGVCVCGGVFATVLGFGLCRILWADDHPPTVRLAGVSVNNLPFFEAAYQDAFGRKISIPATVSQASPLLQEAGRGFVPFIENPYDARFMRTRQALQHTCDRLFEASEGQARAGAQLIVWAEANALVAKPDEPALLVRGAAFARRHRVYLLMTVASIVPGKVTAQRKFLENKAVMIGPDGRVLNTYFKNVPVPGVEPSVPGDGRIPLIATPFAKVSPVICYDADFPRMLRQAGRQGTQLLLIPSGDWRAIAPYHTYAALFRGVENGCGVFRQAKGGLSAVCDAYGRIVAQADYFRPGGNVLAADVPVQSVATVYSRLGDVLPAACVLYLVWAAMHALATRPFPQGQVGGKRPPDGEPAFA